MGVTRRGTQTVLTLQLSLTNKHHSVIAHKYTAFFPSPPNHPTTIRHFKMVLSARRLLVAIYALLDVCYGAPGVPDFLNMDTEMNPGSIIDGYQLSPMAVQAQPAMAIPPTPINPGLPAQLSFPEAVAVAAAPGAVPQAAPPVPPAVGPVVAPLAVAPIAEAVAAEPVPAPAAIPAAPPAIVPAPAPAALPAAVPAPVPAVVPVSNPANPSVAAPGTPRTQTNPAAAPAVDPAIAPVNTPSPAADVTPAAEVGTPAAGPAAPIASQPAAPVANEVAPALAPSPVDPAIAESSADPALAAKSAAVQQADPVISAAAPMAVNDTAAATSEVAAAIPTAVEGASSSANDSTAVNLGPVANATDLQAAITTTTTLPTADGSTGVSNSTEMDPQLADVTGTDNGTETSDTAKAERLRQKAELRNQILSLLDDLDKAIPEN